MKNVKNVISMENVNNVLFYKTENIIHQIASVLMAIMKI